MYFVKNKVDKFNKGEHRSKNATPTAFKKTETLEGMGQFTYTQTNSG